MSFSKCTIQWPLDCDELSELIGFSFLENELPYKSNINPWDNANQCDVIGKIPLVPVAWWVRIWSVLPWHPELVLSWPCWCVLVHLSWYLAWLCWLWWGMKWTLFYLRTTKPGEVNKYHGWGSFPSWENPHTPLSIIRVTSGNAPDVGGTACKAVGSLIYNLQQWILCSIVHREIQLSVQWKTNCPTIHAHGFIG